ncbi:unnamed protein product [Symbiodinium sp. CCMP2592]|nr:unnamed protein product [Symbiodinium sp. CCMP2592]
MQATSIRTEAGGVLSHALSGCFTARLDWSVPFRPHALVEFTFLADSATPVPQLPRFKQLEAVKNPFSTSESRCQVLWEGCAQISDITCDLAGWSRDAAASCGVYDNFPGHSFELQVELLSQAEVHWADVGNMPFRQWHSQALELMKGTEPDADWFAATSRQQGHARKVHLSTKSSQYQSWLKSSMQDGMRPLFRSLSGPDAKVERPYLDSALDFRPFLRLEFWAKLWKAQPSPLPDLDAQLHQKARDHASSLPPLSLERIKHQTRKLSNKAGGADGWSYAAMPSSKCCLMQRWKPCWQSSDA